jgi:hypothetical protein
MTVYSERRREKGRETDRERKKAQRKRSKRLGPYAKVLLMPCPDALPTPPLAKKEKRKKEM